MPKKKTNTKSASVKSNSEEAKVRNFSQLKFGESYVSLALGALVVVVLAVVLFLLLKGNDTLRNNQKQEEAKTQETKERTYMVQEGEGLWQISEKVYGNGEYWVNIAEENNLSSPDEIETGMELRLPEVKKKITENQTDSTKIEGDSYKVNEGDTLWDISLNAYGDPYRYVEIATANNIVNPDLIFPDQILKLPRN